MSKLLDNKLFVSILFVFFGIVSIFLVIAIAKEIHHPVKKILSRKIHITESPTPTMATQSALPTNMAAFAFKDNQVYVRYKNIIYSEDDQTQNPQKIALSDEDRYKWTPLIEGPKTEDQIAFDEIFSLKQVPHSKNFFFIMRWDRYLMASGSGGQEIKTFYYDDKKPDQKLSLLFSHIAIKTKPQYNFTKIGSISSDGKYVSFNEYQCWGCPPETPETILINLTNNSEKNIGRVSYFAWKENGNYEYKEYNALACGEGNGDTCTSDETDNQPVKTGTF